MKYLNVFLIVYSLLITNVFGATITDDTLKIGKPGSAGPVQIKSKDGGYLKKEVSGDWLFSNDGLLEKKLGSGSGSGGSGGIQLLENDSFEDGISPGWSNTGGTLTQQTYTNGYEGNLKYARFVATASGEYFETPLKIIPTNVNGGCQADFKKVNITTSDLFKVEVLDSSANVLATGNVKSSSWVKFPTISFLCPTSPATARLRVTSLAAGTIEIDLGYLGSNQNIVETQCQGVPGCEDVFSARVSLSGVVSQENLDWINGNCAVTGTSISTCAYNPNIFTSAPSCTVTPNNSTGGTIIYSWMTAPTSTEVVTKTFQGGVITAVDYYITCQKSGSDFTKAKPQTAVLSEQASWFIDANIGGGNPIVAGPTASYTEATDAGLDLVINQGSAQAEIPCSGTNPSTGLTCASGSESVGIAFIPPMAGRYRVCSYYSSNYGSGSAAMQLVETPNNSQAIIQEGKTRMTITQSSASGGDYAPQSNCGFFNFSDTSKKTIRLMGEVNSGSMGLIADRSASIGQRDIHFTVENITFSQSRPTLTGDQVITKGVTNPKLVSASVSATGTVSNDKGDFINGNCTNANPRVCTFNSIFSSAPNCVTSSIDGGNYSAYHNGSLTSSSISVTTNNTTSGALSSVAFTLICHGE